MSFKLHQIVPTSKTHNHHVSLSLSLFLSLKMSINNFSSNSQETLLWSQQYHLPIMENHHHNDNSPNSPISTLISLHPKSYPSPMAMSFNLNHENTLDDEEHLFPRPTTVDDDEHRSGNGKVIDTNNEFMFEKPLTPSDVGKLNRLVIPKQYAEKYFPLAGTGSDKGLLLSFEDEAGKFWRFRYSYWNSSQSYVLTKGWSRYVKEKRLDAGDVVVFERHRLDIDRLFIGWKRRSSTTVQDSGSAGMVARHSSDRTSNCGGWTRMFYSAHPYPAQKHHHLHGSVPFQSHSFHAESSVQSQTVSVGNSKILRLFGVNLECQTDESEPEPPSTPGVGSSLSGRDPIHHHFYPHSSPLPDQVDFTFSQDVKKKRNHRG